MGKFDKYRIDLKGMKENSLTYDFLLDNIFFADIDGPEVQKGKVKVALTVKKISHVFELNFITEGTVLVACDRCLDDMEVPVVSSDKLMVKFGAEYGEEGDSLIVVPEADGDINVAWLIYEFVSLAVPMKHIHALGKCNKAMAGKLNKHLRTSSDEEKDNGFDSSDDIIISEDDDSSESQIDPRWNDLKKILDNN